MKMKKYKTFEDFENFNEGPIDLGGVELNNDLGIEYAYVDLKPSDIEEQKFIANFYETSLGHIELIDQSKHVYNVVTEERELKAIVYTMDNVDKITSNAYLYFINGLKDPITEVNIPVIESVEDLNLFDYIDEEKLEADFRNKFSLEDFMVKSNEYKFIKTFENYIIFEL